MPNPKKKAGMTIAEAMKLYSVGMTVIHYQSGRSLSWSGVDDGWITRGRSFENYPTIYEGNDENLAVKALLGE